MQAQLQVLVEREVGGKEGVVATSMKVARPQVFDGISSKVSGFVMACRLYIRIKIWEVVVEEQIQ